MVHAGDAASVSLASGMRTHHGFVHSAEVDGSTQSVACSACGAASMPLKRCMYCREVLYCSAACMRADGARHAEVHAMRLLFFAHRQLNYESVVDFEELLTL